MTDLQDVDADALRDLIARDEFFWLDLFDPAPETIELVGGILGLHELAIEDTREFGQRPKADTYGDQLLLVYFGARMNDDCLPVPVEVHFHVSSRFTVSVHREPCREFDVVREQMEHDCPPEPGAVMYRVIDSLTDSIIDVLDHIEDDLEEFEAKVFRRPRARDRDRMAELRRSLGPLRRALATQRQVFDHSIRQLAERAGIDGDVGAYYRDVGDHLARAGDDVEAARDALQGMLDTYTNEVQERLTIVATVFLPLTVITGFFGQNFTWMINHIGSAWAFWGLGVGGLTVSALVIVLWLRRSGLAHGSPDERDARHVRSSSAGASGPQRATPRRTVALMTNSGLLDRS